MFSKYYQSELAYLRELGKSFAQVNPAIAGLLAERGGDPDVERLLEGFAFLTGRIRERLDAAVPEVVHGLSELLLPHYLRPLPSASIVEFIPNARALRGRTRIAAGAQVASSPVDGTSCLFQTTTAVDLLPLTLQEVTLDSSSALSPQLKVSFVTTEQGKAEVFQPEGFRFFIHGDFPVASTVMLWLFRHLRAVHLKDLSGSGKSMRLPPTALKPVGLMPEGALLPWPARANEGYRLLQEYFTLPQKFLFVDVVGLEAGVSLVGERFELAFEFDRPPALPARIGKDLFRLHCAPVLNLFQVDADPLTQRLPGEEHLLRASGVDPHHMEVYSVNAVSALKSGRGERFSYHPFFDFTHALGDETRTSTFYRLRRTRSPLDDGFDTYLSLGTPSDVMPELEEELLSVELTCTHRSLPAKLQLGDLSVATASSPTLAKFRNIVPVSKPVRPPLGTELHWRLLSHLALNQRSMSEPGALRALLELYNFQTGADHPTARANRMRVDSLQAVQVSPVRRFLGGAPVRGSRTVVDVEESRFSGPGDAFLFGEVLDALLASSVTLNAFNELGLRLQPSQLEYAWPPRNGAQTLL